MFSREAVRAATGVGFATGAGLAFEAAAFGGAGLVMEVSTDAADFLAFGAEPGLRAFAFLADLPDGLATRFFAAFFGAGFLAAFLVFLAVFLAFFAAVLLARFFVAAATACFAFFFFLEDFLATTNSLCRLKDDRCACDSLV